MQAWCIFAVAFIVRTVIGYIFYGSIDVSAFISINQHTFNDSLVQHPFTIWCSFPIIPFYLWLCGLLSIKTSLPIAFCFKIIPIFFDALLALLVYDFVQRFRPKHAAMCGYLYALSPVSIIITCIHGQWDALPLFFFLLALFVRDFYQLSYRRYCLYGALFAFSFLLKPIAIVFLPFFFQPLPLFKQMLGKAWIVLNMLLVVAAVALVWAFIFFKLNTMYSIDVLYTTLLNSNYVLIALIAITMSMLVVYAVINTWRLFPPHVQQFLIYQSMAIVGLIAMTAVCFLFLALYGFNLIKVIDKVLRYCNQGIAIFGLPFGYPCFKK
jgi:hypothetical protein